MRINKFIALNTSFSRRKADELIKNKRVFLNNKLVENLGVDVNPEKDKITIDKKEITSSKTDLIYIALNKPSGFICSRAENLNRKTVMELIPKKMNLKPVGRLDKDTEGLILFTNDGDFIYKHTHPKYELEKEYFVIVTGDLTISKQGILENGIIIENKKTAPAKIRIEKREKISTTLKITIHEGRKRQIRKMFDYVGCPVKYLQRIRIGHLHLGTLEKGKFRNLTEQELNAYKRT